MQDELKQELAELLSAALDHRTAAGIFLHDNAFAFFQHILTTNQGMEHMS